MLCRCPWRQKPESGDHCFKVSPVWENVKPPLFAGGWALSSYHGSQMNLSQAFWTFYWNSWWQTNHKTSGYTGSLSRCVLGWCGSGGCGRPDHLHHLHHSSLTIFITLWWRDQRCCTGSLYLSLNTWRQVCCLHCSIFWSWCVPLHPEMSRKWG